MADMTTTSPRVVLVDGCRIPFMRSGTAYFDLIAYDLGRTVLGGLLQRTGLDPALVQRVIMGNVVQDLQTSNMAREAALGAGLPVSIPAFTVTMACISSNQAITSGAELIRTGGADTVIAGGAEILSDVPLRFSKEMRKRLFEARKYRSPLDYRKFIQGLSASDFLPKVPAIAEFSTGEVMGESADKLAAMFGVSRQAQDEYALRSHELAAAATREGKLGREITPAMLPPSFEPVCQDNTIREDSSLEKLAALPPVFVKPFGTVTAGNSSPLSDGAAEALLMSEEKALVLGYAPKAHLRNFRYVAQDPAEELLLGPAYAIPQVLEAADLTLGDIDVFELHEAFAGQVLAVLAALGSDRFAQDRLGRRAKVGEVEMDKLNLWGGSLSLGHPFGATGARLVMTAADRLIEEDGHFALVAACAAGGLGHALLLERYEGAR